MNTDKCPRCGSPLLPPDAYGEEVTNDPDKVCHHCGQEVEWVLQYVCTKKEEIL